MKPSLGIAEGFKARFDGTQPMRRDGTQPIRIFDQVAQSHKVVNMFRKFLLFDWSGCGSGGTGRRDEVSQTVVVASDVVNLSLHLCGIDRR